jgi:hypothetical protein
MRVVYTFNDKNNTTIPLSCILEVKRDGKALVLTVSFSEGLRENRVLFYNSDRDSKADLFVFKDQWNSYLKKMGDIQREAAIGFVGGVDE